IEALQRPKCRFDVDYEQGAFCEWPHMKGLIDAAQLFVAKAYWELHHGSRDEAIKCVTQLLRLAVVTMNHITITQHLISVTISEMGLDATQELLASHELSREELESLASIIAEQYDPNGLTHALKTERCVLISTIRGIAAAGFDALKRYNAYGSNKPAPFQPVSGDPLKFPLRPWQIYCLDDLVFCLQKMERLIMLGNKPFPEVLDAAQSYRDYYREMWYAKDSTWYRHMVTRILDTGLASLFEMEARFLAMLRMAQIALAAEVFKIRAGRYPEKLDDLKLANLAEVRIGPFTARDFIYRREGDSYVLYSVGSNRTDDGGTEVRDMEGFLGDEQGDVVWRGPEKPKAGEASVD
ncbi:MAG: hypothetical protein QGD94_12695, partial [Planctomycetia bacterium]|nr:hypothetical protein [Planctomycetia bacterium]